MLHSGWEEEWKRTKIGLIKLVNRGTSQKIKRSSILFYAHLGEHWKGRYVPRDYVAVKGILPCVGRIGIVEANIDSSCRGVHSSMVDLTSLEILPFYCLRSLINPIVNWLGWILMCTWLCVSLLFRSSLWKSCPAWGWQWCIGLMSTMAYGWVERCSDIASCGATQFQDKCFFVLIFAMYLF